MSIYEFSIRASHDIFIGGVDQMRVLTGIERKESFGVKEINLPYVPPRHLVVGTLDTNKKQT